MTTKHPFAEILQYLVNGGDIDQVQVTVIQDVSEYKKPTLSQYISLLAGTQNYVFRIKPKTAMFYGKELPMYETVKPEIGETYFYPLLSGQPKYSDCEWANDEFDQENLKNGMVFLNREDAIQWAKAMIPRSS